PIPPPTPPSPALSLHDALPISRPCPWPCPSPANAWINSVDFPTPGSPPNSTKLPATSPPPSTRSSSPIPLFLRSAALIWTTSVRSEEHTSELQSRVELVCRLLL